MKRFHLALAAAALAAPTALSAQVAPVVQAITGTRLDIVAIGTSSRVPDLAIISTGVQTQARTASAAIEQNAARMERVRAELKRAGIADRDIQTSSINLNPQYRYADNQPPVLTGYVASNTVSVKFRDLKRSGEILDALVKEGANQINGPSLTLDKPEGAYDEARMKAIANGRARADVYARALGMQVVKLLSVSEAGSVNPSPIVVTGMRTQMAEAADTRIDAGEQELQVSVSMSFELQ